MTPAGEPFHFRLVAPGTLQWFGRINPLLRTAMASGTGHAGLGMWHFAPTGVSGMDAYVFDDAADHRAWRWVGAGALHDCTAARTVGRYFVGRWNAASCARVSESARA